MGKRLVGLVLVGSLLINGCSYIMEPIGTGIGKVVIGNVGEEERLMHLNKETRKHYTNLAISLERKAADLELEKAHLNAEDCYLEATQLWIYLENQEKANKAYNYFIDEGDVDRADYIFKLMRKKGMKTGNSKIEGKEGINR